jgi:hypothetical protein
MADPIKFTNLEIQDLLRDLIAENENLRRANLDC